MTDDPKDKRSFFLLFTFAAKNLHHTFQKQIPAYDSQLKHHNCSTMSANKRQANTGVDGAELGEASSLLIDGDDSEQVTATMNDVEKHSMSGDAFDIVKLGVPIFISMLSWVGVSKVSYIL